MDYTTTLIVEIKAVNGIVDRDNTNFRRDFGLETETVFKYYNLENNVDYLPSIETVEFRLKRDSDFELDATEIFWLENLIGLMTTKMTNLYRYAFNNFKANYCTDRFLKKLSEVRKITSLAVVKCHPVAETSEDILFSRYFGNIARLRAINSSMKTIINLRRITYADIEMSADKFDGLLQELYCTSLVEFIARNLNTLKHLSVRTISSEHFVRLCELLQRQRLNLQGEYVLHYTATKDSGVRYHPVANESPNKNNEHGQNIQARRMKLETDTFSKLVSDVGLDKFYSNDIAVEEIHFKIINNLDDDELKVLQQFMAKHKKEIEYVNLELATKALLLVDFWPKIAAALKPIPEFTLRSFDKQGDVIEKFIDEKQKGAVLKYWIRRDNKYGLIVSDYIMLDICKTSEETTQFYVSSFARLPDGPEALFFEDEQTILLARIVGEMEAFKRTNSSFKPWSTVRHIQANVLLDQKERLKPLFGYAKMLTITLKFKNMEDAEVAKKWDLGSDWNEGQRTENIVRFTRILTNVNQE